MQRLERIIQMIDIINRGRTPTTEYFCELFECAPRTVHEDIRFLKENLGYAIRYDSFKGGYINTDPKQKLPEFDLAEGEIVALTLGKEMLSEYTGTSLKALLESGLDKIAARLPERVRVNLNDLVGAVKFKTSGVIPVSRELFFKLNDACDEQRVVQIVYFSAHNGQSTFRQIEPYKLVENRGAWYCLAWCRTRQAIRIFALHRMTEVCKLVDTFDIREGVDVDACLNAAFLLEHGDPPQKYVIKFDQMAARYVRERQWHSSQELLEHADGSCTLSFIATRLDEIKRWVMPYGASAEVVEPEALRISIKEELERWRKLYSQEGHTANTDTEKRAPSSSPTANNRKLAARSVTNGHNQRTKTERDAANNPDA